MRPLCPESGRPRISRGWVSRETASGPGITSSITRPLLQEQQLRVRRQPLRVRLGVPERYFLFVGRFATEKNLLSLLEAYAKYRTAVGRRAWGLVLVGSGPLETKLRAQAQELCGVVFARFQQMDNWRPTMGLRPVWCCRASARPGDWWSTKRWQRACRSLLSHCCGSVPELLRSGVNGYVCDPLDLDGIARLMGVMSSDAVDVNEMGEASRQIVAQYTPETWAQTLADCIERTLACKQET